MHKFTWYNLLQGLCLLLALSSCSNETKEKLDTMWLRYDPVGHRRFHREKYYPNEQRMGLRMPKGYTE